MKERIEIPQGKSRADLHGWEKVQPTRRYFPRTRTEEGYALSYLPEDVGDEVWLRGYAFRVFSFLPTRRSVCESQKGFAFFISDIFCRRDSHRITLRK